MAGDWIKVGCNVGDKPAVLSISKALGVTKATVIGGAVLIWIWFDQHSGDGYAPVTLELLSDLAGVPGLAEAMAKEGWLGGDEEKSWVVDWDVHNSKSAKNRALSRDRMQRSRDARSATPAQPEKRREEILSLTLEEAMAAAGRLKIAENCARKWWLGHKARRFEKLPPEWEADLERYGMSWEALERRSTKPNGASRSLPSGLSMFEAKQSLEALKKRLAELEFRGHESMGTIQWATQSDAQEARTIKKRIKEIEAEVRGFALQSSQATP